MAGYAIGVVAMLLSSQPRNVIISSVVGLLIAAGSLLLFIKMAYEQHVSNAGHPSAFPFTALLLISVGLLVPYTVLAYFKLKRNRDSEND